MLNIKGQSFDEIYAQLMKELSENPQFVCQPRGQKIKEHLVVSLQLTNPRARIITHPERQMNLGFAVGEFLWYWAGRQDLETMLYYNKRMGDFSKDGQTLNSAYGYRIHTVEYGVEGDFYSQWDAAHLALVQDTDSRRALVVINLPEDEIDAVTVGSKDVPCTLALQFLIRENKLHMHVTMRSNDAVWGLTSDLFSFTLFQECMLLGLKKEPKFRDLEMGHYFHTAGSMHIYERHFEMARKIAHSGVPSNSDQGVMPPISSLEDLDKLLELEEELRTKKNTTVMTQLKEGAGWMATQLNLHRSKRDSGK